MVRSELGGIRAFFDYINERYRIYLRKTQGDPWPWTDDEILQTYSFCNVYREDDTVTEWIRKNWREPYHNHPNLAFAMAVARQINWPPTLEAIGFPEEWDPERVKAIMQDRKDKNQKVYTGAYMLTGTLGGTKIEQTVDKILTPLYNNHPEIVQESLRETWQNYLPYSGFSGFMAYEVVTDLRHTSYLQQAKDIHSWANAGPGAKRGLNRIYNRPLEENVKSSQLTDEMKELQDMSYRVVRTSMDSGSQDYLEYISYLIEDAGGLEMRDIEHNLCEFDKYERVRLGEGRPRSKYNPNKGVV